MADLTFFQEAFDRHATNGAVGDPNGTPGFAYLRVSSSGQAEEGRSGLPRQIARVHEVAAKEGIRIPWDYVFADDHTGFQFHDRPELSRLRAEYTRHNRRADTVVMEYLDRLSRNADWHQGYLLDEMRQHQIKALFWKGFTSRVERAVMGAVSQDGMERTLEMMREGTLEKARSGRITSKRPAYGYMFVDSEGKPSPKARKETYYAPHPEHADIIRLIFYKIGVEGMKTQTLCWYLQERYTPPGKYTYWKPSQIVLFIRSTVYKGEYYANRYQTVYAPAKHQEQGEPVKMTPRMVERPRDEWIFVPVPPLVSVELWDAANAMLDKHSTMSKRNGKVRYLLTGLVRCAECNSAYCGDYQRRRLKSDPNKFSLYRAYRCHSNSRSLYYLSKGINCTQGQLKAETVEDAVWQAVCQFVTNPERIIDKLEEGLNDGGNAGLRKQITFLEQQIADSTREDDKLYRAFMADVFDEEEYAARRNALKAKTATLEQEREELLQRMVSREQVEQDKALILELAAVAKQKEFAADTTTFEFKQRVLKLLVDKIILDVRKREFRIEGQITGVWSIDGQDEKTDTLPPAAVNNTTAGEDIATNSTSGIGTPLSLMVQSKRMRSKR